MTEKKSAEKSAETKKKYEKPAVQSGKIYEVLAVACSKEVSGTGVPQCSTRSGLQS